MSEYVVRYDLRIDGLPVLPYVRSVSWDFRRSAPFGMVTIGMASLALFDLCHPERNRGTPRIEFTLDGRTWQFLLETRSPQHERTGSTFSTGGRDPAAVLDAPHAPLIDVGVAVEESESGHAIPIPTDTTAATLAATIVNQFFRVGALSWEIEDWPIYAGTFVAIKERPFAILQRLASTARAKLRYDPTARVLRVFRQVWDLSRVSAVASLTSADHVEKISDDMRHGPGTNRIHVTGGLGSSGEIQLELEQVPGTSDEIYVTAYCQPVEKLDWIHYGATDGEWVLSGEDHEGHPLGRDLDHEVTGEEWNFSGATLEARYPVCESRGAVSIEWLSKAPHPTLQVLENTRHVELVDPTETQKWMSLGLASYVTRRNRVKLVGLTEPTVKVQAYYEE